MSIYISSNDVNQFIAERRIELNGILYESGVVETEDVAKVLNNEELRAIGESIKDTRPAIMVSIINYLTLIEFFAKAKTYTRMRVIDGGYTKDGQSKALIKQA